MSGTSCDGVSGALVEVSARKLKVLAHVTEAYPRSLRAALLRGDALTTPEVCALNFKLGGIFASAGRRTLRMAGVPSRQVAVVGSHGHTLWHAPGGKAGSTLQIGEAARIAQALGVPVVADFRVREVAAGRQGAPLIPHLDTFLFGDGPPRLILNLGGIANVTLTGRGTRTLAFDTGPGNGLLDRATRQGTRGAAAYDAGGRRAARGRLRPKVLRAMLADPFFRRKPPKSLDASYFGAAFLKKHFTRVTPNSLDDDLATLAAFTAAAVADQVRRYVPGLGKVRELVASGGGAFNVTLMAALADALPGIRVSTSDDFGVPVMAKEAACFALLGLRRLRGTSNLGKVSVP